MISLVWTLAQTLDPQALGWAQQTKTDGPQGTKTDGPLLLIPW